MGVSGAIIAQQSKIFVRRVLPHQHIQLIIQEGGVNAGIFGESKSGQQVGLQIHPHREKQGRRVFGIWTHKLLSVIQKPSSLLCVMFFCFFKALLKFALVL